MRCWFRWYNENVDKQEGAISHKSFCNLCGSISHIAVLRSGTSHRHISQVFEIFQLVCFDLRCNCAILGSVVLLRHRHISHKFLRDCTMFRDIATCLKIFQLVCFDLRCNCAILGGGASLHLSISPLHGKHYKHFFGLIINGSVVVNIINNYCPLEDCWEHSKLSMSDCIGLAWIYHRPLLFIELIERC